MRLLIRSACRLTPVALLAAMVFVALSAQAQTPPAGVTVTIQPDGGGSPATISTGDVASDVDTTYTVARPAGGTRRVAVSDGVSVLKLLEETDTDFDYATIEIQRPNNGGTLRLTKEQVEAVKPPAFYTDARGVTRFVGPTRDSGSVAAEDYFEVSGTVELAQRRASKLKVTIDPTRKKIGLGESVSFRARATGFEEGERVTYKWGIAGKRQRFAGPSYTQTFPKRDGVYELLVAVRIEGDSASSSAVAKITVGDPKKADEEQVGDGDGADGGTTDGGGAGYDGGTSYPPAYTPPATATPPPPATPPPARTVSPSPDIATDSGTTVEGNLLADASNPPPSNILESAARAAREGKQADEKAGEGAGVPEAAASIAGVLALLGLGAGIENRQGRRPRLRRPRLPLPRRGA
jgi:hypothetical protein